MFRSYLEIVNNLVAVKQGLKHMSEFSLLFLSKITDTKKAD